MAKRIRVSDDSGSNWYTLPGNTGELSNEATPLTDTIFGQDFESQEIGLISWQVTSNALFKGFAGYLVDVKVPGTPTATTGEACSLESGKTYQIDDAAKQIWDRSATVTVYDNGSDETAEVVSIDYLFGRVTFDASYTVTGPVTVDVTYLPTSNIAGYRTFTLTQTANAVNNTDIPSAQANSGHNTFEYGLKTVNLNLSGVFKTSNAFRAALIARSELVVEINPDGNSESVARGFFKYTNQGQSGNVGDLEEETITLTLNVPDLALLEDSFKWVHTSSTLSTAVQKVITAWETNTEIDCQYLHDGTNGVSGSAVVTDLSLTSGLESMNEFSVTLQGTGALTTVP